MEKLIFEERPDPGKGAIPAALWGRDAPGWGRQGRDPEAGAEVGQIWGGWGEWQQLVRPQRCRWEVGWWETCTQVISTKMRGVPQCPGVFHHISVPPGTGDQILDVWAPV